MSIKENTRRTISFYMMVSPWLIIFVSLSLVPLLYGLFLSFTNYRGFNIDNLRFVGLDNYKLVLTDNDAMPALRRTLLFALVNVPLGSAIAFLLAMLLNNNARGTGIYRTIFYLPSIIPIITTILLFKNILFNTNGGILNTILNLFGIGSVNWLGYSWAPVALLLLMNWGAGGGILIYLAGLQGIASEYYESASIDGANALQKFWHITTPLMTPTIFFNMLMGIIGSLQIYMQPILLTGEELLARPIRPIYFYNVHAFQQIFNGQRFSYGMAALWVLFVVILFISIVVFVTRKYWVYSEVEN